MKAKLNIVLSSKKKKKDDNKKLNPIWQNNHLDYLQTVNGGDSREMTEPPNKCHANGHWQQPLERKNFERTKPRNLISTRGPLLRKTITENDSRTPTFTRSGTSRCQETDVTRGPSTGEILKKCGTYIQWAMSQTWRTATEIMRSGQLSPQNGLWSTEASNRQIGRWCPF